MEFSWLRIYFLAGLLLHKAVWEVLKVRQGAGATPKPRSLKVRVLSAIKVAVLLGIIAQTVLPEFLTISSNPSVVRMVGAALYTLGLAMAIAGRMQLGWNWSDIEKAYVKKDHALVSHGLYRYIRHPIYAGDLLLILGLELGLNSWGAAGVVLLAAYVRRQAVQEEGQLRRALAGYEAYYRRTSRFLPFVPI
jgi:protein-S-isoprenylcysteine O-methyltransferase Ste14